MADFCHCFFSGTFVVSGLFVVSFFVNNSVKVQLWPLFTVSLCYFLSNLVILSFSSFFHLLFSHCISRVLLDYNERLMVFSVFLRIFFNVSIFNFFKTLFIGWWSYNNQFDFWILVFMFVNLAIFVWQVPFESCFELFTGWTNAHTPVIESNLVYLSVQKQAIAFTVFLILTEEIFC